MHAQVKTEMEVRAARAGESDKVARRETTTTEAVSMTAFLAFCRLTVVLQMSSGGRQNNEGGQTNLVTPAAQRLKRSPAEKACALTTNGPMQAAAAPLRQ